MAYSQISPIASNKAPINSTMHAKPDLRVFLKWMIAGSGSVIVSVILLGPYWNSELSELNQTPERASRWSLSFTLRELLLLFVIASLALLYFVRKSPNPIGNSKASFTINSPIEYRYWHQRGPNGYGTGQVGSGNEWKPAQGIEVFENFIILHLDNGVDRMVEREDLQWFDWRRTGVNRASGRATRTAPSSAH